MHHVIVTRVSISLTVLLCGLVLGFALVVAAPSEPAGTGDAMPGASGGAALFEQHCGGCHDSRKLGTPLREADDPATLKREWLALLDDHGRASADEDRRIVAYLEAGE